MHRHHVEFGVGAKVFLLMRNLKLHGSRKFRDRFVSPFVATESIGETSYRLDLSLCAALRGVHNVFHASLLRDWQNNGVHADVPPIEIDGEAEYEVGEIKGHRVCNGEVYYLTLFAGFDSSEDMWLNEL